MAEPTPMKYRAFLSYSHADTAWAKWLHRSLESFRIDKDLVDRDTALGPVPRTLRPIFRDREDFSGGHPLADATIAALDAAAALIVVCSPHAAGRPAVNEEVRLFRSRHPGRPVVPIFIDGTWPDNTPPALRFELAVDGTITERPIILLGPDLREGADGKRLGLAKAVAGLIGIPVDDIFRRAERAENRRTRIRNAIIAVLAFLTILAAGSAAFAWHQLKTNEAFLNATLKNATDIVNTAVAQATRYNVPRKATLELLARAEALFDDMGRLGRPTPQLRFRKAEMLIAFSNNYQILGDSVNRDARAQEAYRLLAELVAEEPRNYDFHYSLATACDTLGSVRQERGDLEQALDLFQQGLAIREHLARDHPDHIDLHRYLAGSKANVGSVLLSQERFAEGFKTYRESLDIIERLAKSYPSNIGLQYDLVATYFTLGDLLYRHGGRSEAQTPENLAVRNRLANPVLKKDEVVATSGHYAEALEAFRKGLAIAERLNNVQPGDSLLHERLYLLHERIGLVFFAKDDLAEALASFYRGAEIAKKLVQADPSNAFAERNLSVFYAEIGDVFHAQNNQNDALKWYLDSLAIRSRLAKTYPDNVRWQQDLSWIHDKLANVYQAKGEISKAREELLAGRAVVQRLAENDPKASWKDRLTWYEVALAGVDVAKLESAINEAEKNNQYEKALELQESFAKFVEDVETRHAKVGTATGKALGAVAWRALFARNFTRSLQASNRAISLAPDELWLETNRAHALLFLGEVEEARRLYLAHRGQKVGSEQDAKIWDQAITDDFALLRKAGLAHPLMEEIEESFASKKGM
jgi:tetratricopeptide (TPR) repeat protein